MYNQYKESIRDILKTAVCIQRSANTRRGGFDFFVNLSSFIVSLMNADGRFFVEGIYDISRYL